MSSTRAVESVLAVQDFALRRPNGFAVRLPEMHLASGEAAALYGPSGCGKTSMLMALLGVLEQAETTGSVRVGGREVSCSQHTTSPGSGVAQAERAALVDREFRRNEVFFLAQDALAVLDPLTPVGVQIRAATGAAPEQVGAALAELGVEAGVAIRRRHEISGGQAQRVLIAMAMLRRPALVLADEPSASLDGGSYDDLVAQLRELLARGSALLLATHDDRLLRDLDAAVHTERDGVFERRELDLAPWPERITSADLGAEPVLVMRSVARSFGARPILVGVDFELRRGEIVAIVGESGAGKTTLARLLAGHLEPDAGTIERPGRRPAVQLCPQDALGSMTPGMTLRTLVREARTTTFDLEATGRALQIDGRVLAQVGATMSGGEQRRAVLLRALAVEPDVLILDEPTASLDRATATAVLRELLALQSQRGLALVLVTHDLDLARAVAHRVLAIENGRLRER